MDLDEEAGDKNLVKRAKTKVKKATKKVRRRNSLHQVTAAMAARTADVQQRIDALKKQNVLKDKKMNEPASGSGKASASAVGWFVGLPTIHSLHCGLNSSMKPTGGHV